MEKPKIVNIITFLEKYKIRIGEEENEIPIYVVNLLKEKSQGINQEEFQSRLDSLGTLKYIYLYLTIMSEYERLK